MATLTASAIPAVVAAVEGSQPRVLGSSSVPSIGIRKGVVVNLTATVDSVRAALELAEERSKTIVESAHVSLGSAYLRGVNCSGQTDVRGRNDEITPEVEEGLLFLGHDVFRSRSHEISILSTRKLPVQLEGQPE